VSIKQTTAPTAHRHSSTNDEIPLASQVILELLYQSQPQQLPGLSIISVFYQPSCNFNLL
jgi:hypothetical protein